MSEPADMHAPTRNRGLIVAGAVTLAATAWAALQTDDAPPASERSRTAVATGNPTAAAGRERASRTVTPASAAADAWPEAPSMERRAPWPAAAAQGVSAWGTPAPPPAPAAPPPTNSVAVAAPPQAPPFPYTLIGRIDDGEPRALLSGPLRSFGVKQAEVLDGTWRIDAVEAQGITVTWLPAGLKKIIPFASS